MHHDAFRGARNDTTINTVDSDKFVSINQSNLSEIVIILEQQRRSINDLFGIMSKRYKRLIQRYVFYFIKIEINLTTFSCTSVVGAFTGSVCFLDSSTSFSRLPWATDDGRFANNERILSLTVV